MTAVVRCRELHDPMRPARSLLKKAAVPGVFAGLVFEDLG
jgi:hypothetical protein